MATLDVLRHLPFVRIAQPVRFPPGTGAGNRAAPRRAITVEVEVCETGGSAEPLPLNLTEISATGAFVRSDLLLPIGSTLELTFRIEGRRETIRAEGRVVRVADHGDAPGMGIHFERMPADARATLRQYTHWN